MNSNRAILLTGLLLVLALAVETTPLDLLVQDQFYDSASGWRVDRHAALPKAIFYDGPKVFLGVIVLLLFVCIGVPASRSARLPFSRRDAAFLLLCLGLIVVTVGLLKDTTGIFGPYKLARYGGEQPHRTLLESIPHVAGRDRGRNFPAAHCTLFLPFMALYFVFKGRMARWLGLGCGFAAGWIVGVYQMLKGAHFLSHTIVTTLLGWMIILIVSRAFRLGGAAQPYYAGELHLCRPSSHHSGCRAARSEGRTRPGDLGGASTP